MQSQRQGCRQKVLIYQKNKIWHTKAVEFAKRYDKILQNNGLVVCCTIRKKEVVTQQKKPAFAGLQHHIHTPRNLIERVVLLKINSLVREHRAPHDLKDQSSVPF